MAPTTAPKGGRPKAPPKASAPVPYLMPAADVYPTVGRKIAELVESRGMSIARAAMTIPMNRQFLFRIIKGEVKNPGILTVQEIITGLGGRMQDLWNDGDLLEAPDLVLVEPPPPAPPAKPAKPAKAPARPTKPGKA
jgi:hypothetical protein